WRIVDAVSNYNETTQIVTDEDGNEQEIQIPDPNIETTDYWEDWVGFNTISRIGTAFTAVFVSSVGSLGVLVFSGLSVMYTVGIAILMAFSPLFFLLACIPEKGESIFKGWLQTVLNTTIKRFVLAVLLVLTLAITVAAMDAMEEIGWFKAIMTLALLTFLLVK